MLGESEIEGGTENADEILFVRSCLGFWMQGSGDLNAKKYLQAVDNLRSFQRPQTRKFDSAPDPKLALERTVGGAVGISFVTVREREIGTTMLL